MEEEQNIVKKEPKVSPFNDIEAQQNSEDLAGRKRVQGKYVEPLTHRENKSTWEWLFGSCLGQSLDLNAKEIEEFGILREEGGEKFDQSNPTHMSALGELWGQLTGTIMDRSNFQQEKWVTFGFQNKNPTTDFRGGGFQSLMQMIKFSTQNNQLVITQMCAPENDFFFALASINVTFYLKQTLHLAIHLHPSKDRNLFCNRQSLKSFCSLLVEDDKIFDRFHEIVLKDLFESWVALKKAKPSTSLLNFPEVEVRYKRKFKTILEGQVFHQFSEFETAYKNDRRQ